MRATGIVLIGAAACGSASAPVLRAGDGAGSAASPTRARGSRAEIDDPQVDPLVELAREDYAAGWIAPRQLVLAPHGTPLYPPANLPVQQVQILERHGRELRIGVRQEGARFALWTDTTGLLATVKRALRVETTGTYGFTPDAQVELQAGAPVSVLGKDDHRTHVRYLGALEVDGWIPTDALGDRGPSGPRGGSVLRGMHPLTVMPGTAIRTEARWGAPLLAVVAHSYFIDDLKDLGDGKHEVEYLDADVHVHGFVATRDPPEAVRGRPRDPPPPVGATPTTATVASGTCLYDRPRGDAIGYIDGATPVDLEPGSGSWFTITLDTVWGPLTFAAQGASVTDLVACAKP